MVNYLVIQLMYRCFRRIAGNGNGNYICYWEPKGLTDEKSNSSKTPNDSITPNLSCYDVYTRVGLMEAV